VVGRFAKRDPESIRCGVQAALGIDKDARRPEPLVQFLSCHHLPGSFKQRMQQPERLALQFQPYALFAQFAGPKIELKDTETGDLRHGVPRS
jgi:hypothetical protein